MGRKEDVQANFPTASNVVFTDLEMVPACSIISNRIRQRSSIEQLAAVTDLVEVAVNEGVNELLRRGACLIALSVLQKKDVPKIGVPLTEGLGVLGTEFQKAIGIAATQDSAQVVELLQSRTLHLRSGKRSDAVKIFAEELNRCIVDSKN